jgi:hypothetical protein
MASSLWESASARFSANTPSQAQTHYTLRLSPQLKFLMITSKSPRPTDDLRSCYVSSTRLTRTQQLPRSPRPTNGRFTPRLLGPAAFVPSRSPRPTVLKITNDFMLKGSTTSWRPPSLDYQLLAKALLPSASTRSTTFRLMTCFCVTAQQLC